MSHNISVLPHTKGFVVRVTPKSVGYRLRKYIRRFKDKSLNKGNSFWFRDFGHYACLNDSYFRPSYDNNGKLAIGNNTTIWFKIIDGRLRILIRNGTQPQYLKNISNNPFGLFHLCERYKGLNKQFYSILFRWLRREGIIIPKRLYKAFPEKELRNKLITLCCCYPGLTNLLEVYPHCHTLKIDSHLTKCFKNKINLNDLFDKIFGCHGPSLKKVLSNKSMNFSGILTGRILKGIIPIDDVVFLLSRENAVYFPPHRYGIIQKRRFLKNFHRETILKWILDINSFYFLEDTIKMYNEYHKRIQMPKSNNLKEIHDYLAREIPKLRSENVSFDKIVKKYAQIQNLEFDNFRIEIPESSYKLIDYSQEMHNCIASYSNDMLRGSYLLLGVYKDGKLTYNIMIDNNKNILQFYGIRNSLPDRTDKRTIINKLSEHNIAEVIPENNNIIEADANPVQPIRAMYLNLLDRAFNEDIRPDPAHVIMPMDAF